MNTKTIYKNLQNMDLEQINNLKVYYLYIYILYTDTSFFNWPKLWLFFPIQMPRQRKTTERWKWIGES